MSSIAQERCEGLTGEVERARAAASKEASFAQASLSQFRQHAAEMGEDLELAQAELEVSRPMP